MKVLGIIVARMGSTRVPGKALLDIGGGAVIEHVLRTAKCIEGLDQICLATSNLPKDEPIGKIATKLDVPTFFGDPENVLDRVYGAVENFGADAIVEIGGDCPLLDPTFISQALLRFKNEDLDYLSNYDPPTFPEGMDINIVATSALKKAYDLALAPSQRIHPFSYLTHHADQFKLGNFAYHTDLSDLHWSLDFPEDLEFIRYVFSKLKQDSETPIPMAQVLELIETDAKAYELNEKLRKPKSLHAFWNSPGIVRDMHEDVRSLASIGAEFMKEKNFAKAHLAYEEMISISKYLLKMAEFNRNETNK